MTDPVRPGAPRLIAVTIDCTDLEAMLAFWSGLLGGETQLEEPFGFIQSPGGRGAAVWLQRVPESHSGKNRLHVDLVSDDLATTEKLIEELGGSLDGIHEWHGFRWRTCRDPEGNVFDVMQGQAAE
ncbi:MAG TPA: VOC family protein [Acidimicrobiia bacterium]|jgi:predicted enzyme related to lactoylglutathione lyase